MISVYPFFSWNPRSVFLIYNQKNPYSIGYSALYVVAFMNQEPNLLPFFKISAILKKKRIFL